MATFLCQPCQIQMKLLYPLRVYFGTPTKKEVTVSNSNLVSIYILSVLFICFFFNQEKRIKMKATVSSLAFSSTSTPSCITPTLQYPTPTTELSQPQIQNHD